MAAGLLSKIHYYVPKFLLRTIYFSIFNSHLIYTCQIWGQKGNTIKKLSEIQDKAVCIISFKDKSYPTNDLYHNNEILKITDYIKLLNCLFIKSILLNNHLPIFENSFKKASETHSGKFSITYQIVYTWNDLQNKSAINMLEQSNSKVKTALVQLYFNNCLN